MNDAPVQFCIHHKGSRTLGGALGEPLTTEGLAVRTSLELEPTLDVTQVLELFGLAAFWARERRPEEMALAIANSEPVVSAWCGEQLVGFARATSDGVYRGTIWDVVVHPEFQGRGIGRKLVETLLSHPKMSRVERVYLTTTYQQRFYERIGFQVNQSTTMVLQNSPLEMPLTTKTLEELALRD